MSLEIACPLCGRLLRVEEEHGGKQIRCPACQEISVAPGGQTGMPDLAPSLTAVPELAATTWHLRTPEGATYGPVSWLEVLSWVAEGRIADDCELADSSKAEWRPASSLIPGLGRSQLKADDGLPNNADGLSPAAPTAKDPYAPAVGTYVAPHRGPLVLIMGLLGIVVGCPIFSIIAWIMGSRDMAEMRAGRMDRSGEGLTLAGMVLGIMVAIMWLLFSFFLLVGALIFVGRNF